MSQILYRKTLSLAVIAVVVCVVHTPGALAWDYYVRYNLGIIDVNYTGEITDPLEKERYGESTLCFCSSPWNTFAHGRTTGSGVFGSGWLQYNLMAKEWRNENCGITDAPTVSYLSHIRTNIFVSAPGRPQGQQANAHVRILDEGYGTLKEGPSNWIDMTVYCWSPGSADVIVVRYEWNPYSATTETSYVNSDPNIPVALNDWTPVQMQVVVNLNAQSFQGYVESTTSAYGTFGWGGIESLTDYAGNLIEDFTVTDVNGVNMVEPATMPPLADLNDDFVLDAQDLRWLAYRWLNPDCEKTNDLCAWADIHPDGVVDTRDFASFADNWKYKSMHGPAK